MATLRGCIVDLGMFFLSLAVPNYTQFKKLKFLHLQYDLRASEHVKQSERVKQGKITSCPPIVQVRPNVPHAYLLAYQSFAMRCSTFFSH